MSEPMTRDQIDAVLARVDSFSRVTRNGGLSGRRCAACGCRNGEQHADNCEAEIVRDLRAAVLSERARREQAERDRADWKQSRDAAVANIAHARRMQLRAEAELARLTADLTRLREGVTGLPNETLADQRRYSLDHGRVVAMRPVPKLREQVDALLSPPTTTKKEEA